MPFLNAWLFIRNTPRCFIFDNYNTKDFLINTIINKKCYDLINQTK